ncbi:M23 family metallopeptidase [Dyadobacter tibetensis]|uniref:M23 family metallopeptidase n=1 Tax=Dyadobacter tibetensis TaxID=1211851 RepID=UPI00047289F7|nr:M23 family metallopeptidase [Dyadobacter tibetensis]
MSIMRMLGVLLILIFSAWTREQPSASSLIMQYCENFKQIQIDIRDCNISPDSAARAFQVNMLQLGKLFGDDSCSRRTGQDFVFPVKGYSPRESIGGRGKGYRPEGFDLFDMQVRGSHPAHDIFIRDRDKDQLDDATGEPVDVLAFTTGMVLASEKNWQFDSDRRGGNWIWIYDPCLKGIFYYAHNKTVVVEPGQWVEAGEKIAEMGRTGFSAHKSRSPTHLHFMYLKINRDGLPEPDDTYDWLMEAITKD